MRILVPSDRAADARELLGVEIEADEYDDDDDEDDEGDPEPD